MRARAASLLALLALAGCATPRAASPRATLPPDSLELLRQALERVRPGYPTQAEALRAGVYGRRDAAIAAEAEPAAAPPPALPGRVVPEPRPRPAPQPAPALPTPASPAPAPPPPGAPAPDPGGAYVVQIAAFRDEASARVAADDAVRRFPALVPVIELADGWYRVALAGWVLEHDARATLPAIQELYPSAWVRGRALP